MPLTRYEIRSEYSLANPDLYRAAEKDDPEGLLEGVAMAGLVGIIRQLGDLAEFAAEVFHDLHEEVLATAAKGHELVIRIRQLEMEIPLLEKLMFTKDQHGNFMYNQGVEWHAHIHNEQNHFTQGDLPRFVRSAYEDCRSPPRLFFLDRFDVAGAGACLKRFTDPSFFKMEWASSELMKAEKEKRDQRARWLKKKAQRQGNGEVGEASLVSQIQSRSSEVNYSTTLDMHSSTSESSLGSKENEDMHVFSSLPTSEQERSDLKGMAIRDFKVKELPLEPLNLNTELSTIGTINHTDVVAPKEDLETSFWAPEGAVDDFASETDNFVDALTTMDSEVETDSEVKTTIEVDCVRLKVIHAYVLPNQPALESSTRSDEEDGFIEVDVSSVDQKQDMSHPQHRECGLVGVAEEEEFRAERAHFASRNPAEQEKLSIVNGNASTPRQDENASSPGLEQEKLSIVNGNASTPRQDENASTPMIRRDASSPGLEQEKLCIVNGNASTPRQDENASTPMIRCDASSPGLEETGFVASEGLSEFQNSETPEVNFHGTFQMEQLSASHQLPASPAVQEDEESQCPKVLGSLTGRRRWQAIELFNKECLASDLIKSSVDNSEGEESKQASPQSSANSSIQPMTWAMELSRSYDTDDEMDGMQVSSPSPSSSSSRSSPRPSTLATTVFHLNLESKPNSLESIQGSIVESLVSTSPPVKAFVDSSVSPVSVRSSDSSPPPPTSKVQPTFEHLPSSVLPKITPSENPVANVLAQSRGVNDLEISPPPPPLPPLAWRMSRRSQHNSEAMATGPTAAAPISLDVSVLADELLQPFTYAAVGPTVSCTLVMNPNEQSHAFNSSAVGQAASVMKPNEQPQTNSHTTTQTTYRNFNAMPKELMQPFTLVDTGPSYLQNLHTRSDHVPETSTLAVSKEGTVVQVSVPVLAALGNQGGNVSTPPSNRLPQDEIDNCDTGLHSEAFQMESDASTLEESALESLSPKSTAENVSSPPQRLDISQDLPTSSPPNFERKNVLIEATASHGRNILKRRSKWAWTSSTASSDDREVLLEQIRTRSFSLRHTEREKQAASRPMTNINVAAILEKANAIRQAFADSDEDIEDDEWSDA